MASTNEYHKILIEQAHLLADATEAFEMLVSNFTGLFEDLTEYFKAKHQQEEKDMSEFERYSNRLKQYVDQVHIEIPALTEGKKNYLKNWSFQHPVPVILKSESELQECRKNIEQLEDKLVNQVEDSTKMHKESLESLTSQSSYAAAMGSVLTTMLWKTSKTEDVIATFIDTNTLNHFLNLAMVTMTSFRETYEKVLPDAETNEFKFIVALLGIYINIAAQRVGRDFILDREIGIDFVKICLDYLGEIPMPSGALLKRLILMLLFNVNIDKRGAMIIEPGDKGIESILGCLNMQHTSEIQTLGLNLMEALLAEMPTQEFCDKIISLVSFFLCIFQASLFLFFRSQKMILSWSWTHPMMMQNAIAGSLSINCVT